VVLILGIWQANLIFASLPSHGTFRVGSFSPSDPLPNLFIVPLDDTNISFGDIQLHTQHITREHHLVQRTRLR